ncbi:MAG: hypothetical protein ABR537_01000 [Gemmatimonadales bacterium]
MLSQIFPSGETRATSFSEETMTSELNYQRLESRLDRLVDELRYDMRAGFERRFTWMLFIYSMACAVTNAAIIVVMLRHFGLLH